MGEILGFMELVFGVISALFIMVGHVFYIKGVFIGEVKPQRATWTVIEILTLVTVANQFAADASYSLIPWVGASLTGTVVFVLAIIKGTGGFSYLDIAVVTISILGLVVWLVSGDERNSIIATPIAIALAVTPTIIKATKYPQSENLSQWLCSFVGVIFTILSVGKLDFDLLVIPFTWLAANGVIATIIIIRSNSHERIL